MTVDAIGTVGAVPVKPSKASVFALWVATVLLKLLLVPDPPDRLKAAIAALLLRFGALLAFGVLVPPLCAFALWALDKVGVDWLADGYRDYVVSGFRTNESIYRADRERIDYLFQMRHVNFFEDDEVGNDPSVFISAIPRQQGRLVIQRATLVHKDTRAAVESGGTGAAIDSGAISKCPKQANPNLQSVILEISDATQNTAAGKFSAQVQISAPFEFDKKFWSSLKIDPSVEDSVKSLKLVVQPPNANQTRDCFDLFVDLRVDIYKTRSK